MFQAIICPSSGAWDCGYSNVVYCRDVVVGWRSGVRWHRLCVRCEGCCSSNIPHTEHIVYAAAPRTSNTLHHQDNTPHCCNHSLMLLKMGKWLSETCLADSKINKILIVASSWSFRLFTYNDEERSNTNQMLWNIWKLVYFCKL